MVFIHLPYPNHACTKQTPPKKTTRKTKPPSQIDIYIYIEKKETIPTAAMAKKRRRSKISRKAIGDEEKERQVQHLQHTDRKDGDDDDEVDHDDEVSDHNDNSSSSSPSSSKGDADSSDLSAGTAEDDESSDDTGAGSSAVDWNEDVELVDGFLTNRAFHELDLCEPLKRGIKDLKYHNMSEIQVCSW